MRQLAYVDALVKELTDQIRHSTGEFKHGLEAARRIVMEFSTQLPDKTRVMTLAEILDAEGNVDQCWLENRGIELMCPANVVAIRADIQRWGTSGCQLPFDLYGKYWRMWTGRPTDEQREETKWE